MADTALEASDQDRCANPDCRVSEGGRCVEGFANTADCPQFGKIQTVPAPASANAEHDHRPGVRLPPSTTLSVDEADHVLKCRECRVVAVVGPHAAGKTSLIAGLYDLFQVGPIREVAFGQSHSLHAFEEAAHDSRAASRRELPDTARTARGEVRFYHLDVVETASGAAFTLLLGDRAGEEYLETRSSPASAKAFPELARADVLTTLIDGQRLLDVGARHNVRSEIRQTIQAFVEAGAVSPSQRLAIVLTKVDMIRTHAEAGSRALTDFEGIVASMHAAFGSRFAAIEAFSIAAQPKSNGARRGEGLDVLLAYWTGEPMRYRPTVIAIEGPPADRYFARLQKPQPIRVQ